MSEKPKSKLEKVDDAAKAKKPAVGRTMLAAHSADRDFEGREIVKAGELVDVKFRSGQSPSLAARRTLSLLIGKAAGDAWKDAVHRITKRELRSEHKSNERIGLWLDEVAAIRLTLPTISSRGRASIERAGLFALLTEETEEGDDAWVEYQFSPAARRVFGDSGMYARLNRAALLSFQSKYSVTLYELGSLLVGRKYDQTWRGTIPELRAKLGIGHDQYRNWTDLRRFTLDAAKAEIDHLAHFDLTWQEKRQGRKVVEIELRFLLKEPDDINEASRECDRVKINRKSRRQKTAERVDAKNSVIREQIIKDLRPASPGDYLEDEIPEF